MFFQSYFPLNFSNISLTSKWIDPIISSPVVSSSKTLKIILPPIIGICAGTKNS